MLPDSALLDELRTFSKTFHGPLPYSDFFDGFMKAETDLARTVDFGGLVECSNDLGAACEFLAGCSDQICDKFKFVYSSPSSNVDVNDGFRPPIALYRENVTDSNDPAEDWKAIELFVYIAPEGEGDPWEEWIYPNDENIPKPEHFFYQFYLSRARLATYARAQLSRQHRNFFFQIGIYGQTLHLLRWDPSGVSVTKSCNLLKHPEILCEFLQRFNNLSPEDRGWDMDAQPASREEEKLLLTAIGGYLDKVRAYKVPMVPYMHETVDVRYPTWKVHLSEKYKCMGEECDLIIRRPVNNWACSRRQFVAYHTTRKCLVFYKDNWMNRYEADPNPLTEGGVYRTLHEEGVPNLPTVLYANDIDFRNTRRNIPVNRKTGLQVLWKPYPWVALVGRVQPKYRVQTVQELAYPLVYARNSKQLVSAIRDVLTAFEISYKKTKIVHRNINLTNVMITADGKGIVNDWSSASYGTCAQFDRIGSKGCIALHLLEDEYQAFQGHLHDVESCFWLLLLAGGVTLKVYEHPTWYSEIFKQTPEDFKAGIEIRKRTLVVDLEHTRIIWVCRPFHWLIDEMRAVLGRYYDSGLTDNKDMTAAHLIELCNQAMAREGWREDDIDRDPFPYKVPDRPLGMREFHPVVGDLTGLTARVGEHFALIDPATLSKKRKSKSSKKKKKAKQTKTETDPAMPELIVPGGEPTIPQEETTTPQEPTIPREEPTMPEEESTMPEAESTSGEESTAITEEAADTSID